MDDKNKQLNHMKYDDLSSTCFYFDLLPSSDNTFNLFFIAGYFLNNTYNLH
ncbi:hypothetical protein BVRB_5g125580 [Beta vulgaris subsp. vulgaris]|uniref:Uncharacterized protein n=1 Tax=Beta vulgaris subsp. vulgaris TaxID=3555 RepID=A0A0J8BC22_BETVV|nr:hypothetical protein BVRB_5g125580 [Beta vulgaris subsp. vulgaris]